MQLALAVDTAVRACNSLNSFDEIGPLLESLVGTSPPAQPAGHHLHGSDYWTENSYLFRLARLAEKATEVIALLTLE